MLQENDTLRAQVEELLTYNVEATVDQDAHQAAIDKA